MQDRKLAFLNGPIDKRTVSSERLEGLALRYVVQAGSVIPAALSLPKTSSIGLAVGRESEHDL
jgi:hypothetical protein